MIPSSDDRDLLKRLLGAVATANPGLLPDAPSDRILAIARYHRLTPLLAARCGDRLPASIAATCQRDRVATVARNMIFAQAAAECVRALTDAGIETIVLKGLAYETTLYRDWGAGVRPTSDVDLLVPGAQRRAALDVMDRLGFEPRAAAPGFDESDYHEVAWRRNGIEVDLHLGLAPRARCQIDYDDVWSGTQRVALGQSDARALDAPAAAVFHALHMAIDHFNVPGVYLLDLARMLPDDAACAAAERTARAWRCTRPLATASALVGAFLTNWPPAARYAIPPRFAADVLRDFGPPRPVGRGAQLRRKLVHIDRPIYALRYLLIQARRNARELVERHIRKRSARQRLLLPAR